MATAFNPFDPEFVRDPYPVYAALRSEAAVARVPFGPRQVVSVILALIRMQRERGTGLLESIRMLRKRSRSRRAQGGPGLRARVYTVSRFPEVTYVLKHPEVFSSEIMGGSQVEVITPEGDIAPTSGALIAHDPPEHTRQRHIVSGMMPCEPTTPRVPCP